MADVKVGVGSGGTYGNDKDLSNKTFTLQFVGFRREGGSDELKVDRDFNAFGYEERDGHVIRKKTQTRPEKILTPAQAEAEAYREKIYWLFEVVYPGEFAGEQPPYSSTRAGVYIQDQESVQFVSQPKPGRSMAAFLQTAIACGFKVNKLDAESPSFDGEYVKRLLGTLTYPVELNDVILAVEKMLLEAAANGHLVEAKTGKSNWLTTGTFRALSREEADDIRAKADTYEPQKDEEPIPWDDVSASVIDRAALETKVRDFARTKGKDGLKDMIDWLGENKIAYDKANLLASLSDEALIKVVAWIGESDEVAL